MELHLQYNQITFIHPHAFLHLKKLRILRLNNNQLHTFDSKWLRALKANMFEVIKVYLYFLIVLKFFLKF